MNQNNDITTERVRILYGRAFASINTALAASLIISYIVWGAIDVPVLLTWLGFMFAIALVRYWLLFDYNKNKHNTVQHEKFEKRYSYATALVGLGWAFIIVSCLYLPEFEYRLYAILLLGSIIAISVPIFSSSPKTIYFYLTPPLITSIPLLLSRGGNDTAVGLALVVFTLMIFRTSQDTYKTLIDTLTLRYQTQEQAKKLDQFESSLRVSQQRLLLHREQSPLGIIEWNTSFEILNWNPAAQRIFGYTEEDVLGHHITESILPESSREEVDKIWNELMENKGGAYNINENTTKDGQIILCEWHNTPLVDQDGKVIGVTSVVEDITKREKDKENLRQSQKMEAIGKLTGGIAHDFNNMLNVILGFSSTLKKKLNKDDSELIRYSNQIITAGTRAAKLTSKLLEFSREAPAFYESTNINKLVNEMQDMLEKILTPSITFVYQEEKDIWPVWLDKGRLEDCILNLCLNAMHAMPDGGVLTLKTKNTPHEDIDGQFIDMTAGDYVLLSVSDSGSGMSKAVQEKMFEPFFTTKGDKGTGLGLSQVYGYIQQLAGNIYVFSNPNQGTRIDLYIPRHREQKDNMTDENTTDSLESLRGEETILVVDDEVILLELAEIILTSYGYQVICSESGEQALEILENTSVDLLFTDVIMPGMSGYQLSSEVKRLYPKVKIQVVSGFVEEDDESKDADSLHKNRLNKPYSEKVLLRRLRALLDKNDQC